MTPGAPVGAFPALGAVAATATSAGTPRGVLVVVAGALAGFATLVAGAGRRSAGERLSALTLQRGAAVPELEPAGASRSWLRGLAALAAAAGVVALLGPLGALPAVVVAVVTYRAVPDAAAVSAAADERRTRVAAPLACDLLAAALSAGSPTVDAVTLVATAVDGPLARLLGDVAASLALGAAPGEAWAPVERSPPLRPLARAAVRSATSGAALAGALTALADDLRQAAHADGQVAARRAGVRLVGPLTLCFLPSFVVLGVVPLVLGLLPDVLG